MLDMYMVREKCFIIDKKSETSQRKAVPTLNLFLRKRTYGEVSQFVRYMFIIEENSFSP